MYRHDTCPTPGGRGMQTDWMDGIYLRGNVATSFDPSGMGSGRTFVPDSDYHAGGEVFEVVCYDCDEVIVNYVEPVPLAVVEKHLENNQYEGIVWRE